MTAARRFALGLDFGTESVRALLVDVATGEPVGRAAARYAHGVMEEELCDGGPRLPPEFALQNPQDYLDGLAAAARGALAAAHASAEEVVGIGIDFTACTMLPVDARLAPLCAQEPFRREPHAWVKLWRHHGAHEQAAAINAAARASGESWLARYGGTTSPEWLLAKAWETLVRAPRLFAAADRFVEAGDWIVAQLTGVFARGACAAGYKGLWHRRDGPPSPEFLARLDPRLAGFFDARSGKARGEVIAAGTRVGGLSRAWAGRLGLGEGTAVSAPVIDAHAAVPGAGVSGAGSLVAILGTSACHMVLAAREHLVPGIQGVVEDGILPGFFGYEAGQAAFGDTFDWLVDRLLATPDDRKGAAHAELARAAAGLAAGQCGLLVLDWWNGNRSILVEPRLSGLIVGLTRTTRPHELYRALLEGAAFSTRRIVENFVEHGVAVDEVLACGGVAERNELVLQLLADVTGRRIVRVASPEVCALGAAVFGALAGAPPAGPAPPRDREPLERTLAAMAARERRTIEPRPAEARRFDRLYGRWLELHDRFGRSDLMPFLRDLRGGG